MDPSRPGTANVVQIYEGGSGGASSQQNTPAALAASALASTGSCTIPEVDHRARQQDNHDVGQPARVVVSCDVSKTWPRGSLCQAQEAQRVPTGHNVCIASSGGRRGGGEAELQSCHHDGLGGLQAVESQDGPPGASGNGHVQYDASRDCEGNAGPSSGGTAGSAREARTCTEFIASEAQGGMAKADGKRRVAPISYCAAGSLGAEGNGVRGSNRDVSECQRREKKDAQEDSGSSVSPEAASGAAWPAGVGAACTTSMPVRVAAPVAAMATQAVSAKEWLQEQAERCKRLRASIEVRMRQAEKNAQRVQQLGSSVVRLAATLRDSEQPSGRLSGCCEAGRSGSCDCRAETKAQWKARVGRGGKRKSCHDGTCGNGESDAPCGARG